MNEDELTHFGIAIMGRASESDTSASVDSGWIPLPDASTVPECNRRGRDVCRYQDANEP